MCHPLRARRLKLRLPRTEDDTSPPGCVLYVALQHAVTRSCASGLEKAGALINPMLAIKVTRLLIKGLFRIKVKRPPVGLLGVQGQYRSLSVESQCFMGFGKALFSAFAENSARVVLLTRRCSALRINQHILYP